MAVPISLKRLAELLKLNPSTVSRALKGHPDISQATQERVRALAQELHYKPNALALSLRNKRSNLIAILVPFLGDYFYACAVSRVIQYAYTYGYKVVVLENHESNEQETRICQFLQKSGIDGLIVVPAKETKDMGHFSRLQQEGVPVVFLDRIAPNMDTDRVLEDDYEGAYIALKHMMAGGCRRIAHIALPQQYVWAQKRKQGYIQAVKDQFSSVDDRLIVECEDASEIYGIIQLWMKNFQVDGIFAANDEYAIQVLNALYQMNYRVPGQIAVCGFGNDPVSEVTCPSFTTVSKNGYQMGEIAAELLIRRIENGKDIPIETRILKCNLVVRNSTLPVGKL